MLHLYGKTNYNKKISDLEVNAANMKNTINELQGKIDSLLNTISYADNEMLKEDTITVLVEKHLLHSGMPGPEGATNWGTSKFIASDGWIYEYKYDEYYQKTSYPQEKNVEVLSKELISKAEKTDKKLTDEELKLVKDYIKNIENAKEEIEEIESYKSNEEVVSDYIVHEYFVMYNYVSGEMIPIGHYTSPSINKLLNIVNKYI